jgi:hypothetical protein
MGRHKKRGRFLDSDDEIQAQRPVTGRKEEYTHRRGDARPRRDFDPEPEQPPSQPAAHYTSFGDLDVQIDPTYDFEDFGASPDESFPTFSLPGGLKVLPRAPRYADAVCSFL